MSVICDFCSSSDVTWAFSASDTEMFLVITEHETIHQMSNGDWAACDKCYDLIIKEERELLLDRSVEAFLKNNSNLSEEERLLARPMIRIIQNAFWENMDGKCRRAFVAEFKQKESNQ